MAKIIVTEMKMDSPSRKLIVDTEWKFEEAKYPGRTRVTVGIAGRTFLIEESIEEVYKLIQEAVAKEEGKMLKQIMENQERILEENRKILGILEILFPE